MKKGVLFFGLAILVYACTGDRLTNPLDLELQRTLERLSPNKDLSGWELPASDNYALIPAGKENPLNAAKVELGKMLFFETGIARNSVHQNGGGTYSCATCHVPSAGFMPGRAQGIADGGVGFGAKGEARIMMNNYDETELDVQGARALSLLNVAYVTNTTWSGKFGAHFVNEGTEDLWHKDPTTEANFEGLDGLESQNLEGLDLHRMVVDEYVLDTLGYREMYDEAFGDFSVEERYGKKATSFAISAYLRTLLSNEAPFQQWVKGNDDAMSDAEKRGALVFFGKAGCYRCHKGPGLNSMEFHALGVFDLYESGGFNTGPDDIRNFGRGGFTQNPEDNYKFKVPGIYNMGDSPFYFHGSSRHSLRSVVDYFNRGIPENPRIPEEQISPLFHPLNLTEDEIEDLIVFLGEGLRDPNLNRYVPEETLSGNCFPNNDDLSRRDLGCE